MISRSGIKMIAAALGVSSLILLRLMYTLSQRTPRKDARSALPLEVLVEPGDAAAPCVFGGLGAIARPVVGEEGMRRTGVDHELGRLARRFHGRFHRLYIGH